MNNIFFEKCFSDVQKKNIGGENTNSQLHNNTIVSVE